MASIAILPPKKIFTNFERSSLTLSNMEMPTLIAIASITIIGQLWPFYKSLRVDIAFIIALMMVEIKRINILYLV